MSWILTAGGQQVDMRLPRIGNFNLPDIAHHLSLINRFGGATCRPYSVAEHSLLVCEIAERELHLDAHGLHAALMHDAHEAYIGDISTPGKHEIGEKWFELEYRFEARVRTCFGVSAPSRVYADAIKRADLMALATERAQLLPPCGEAWAALHAVEPVGWARLMDPGRCSFAWCDWRQAFIDRAQELEYARMAGAAA